MTFCAFWATGSLTWADDTEVFFGGNFRPNVLIIFDDSQSMKLKIPYQTAVTYPLKAGCGAVGATKENCVADTLYYQCCTQWSECVEGGGGPCTGEGCFQSSLPAPSVMLAQGYFDFLSQEIANFRWIPEAHAATCPKGGCVNPDACPAGQYRKCRGYAYVPIDGDFSAAQYVDSNLNGIHDGGQSYSKEVVCPDTYVYMGNRINYDNGNIDLRIDAAKKALKTVIEATDGVNFGLMRFEYSKSGSSLTPPDPNFYSQGGTVMVEIEDGSKAKLLENVIIPVPPAKTPENPFWCVGNPAYPSCTRLGRDPLTPKSFTPLAEALTTGGQYLLGELLKGWSGGTANFFKSPIRDYCQSHFIILISDGEPTHDLSYGILSRFLGPDTAGWAKGGTAEDVEDNIESRKKIAYSLNQDNKMENVPQRFVDDVAWVLNKNQHKIVDRKDAFKTEYKNFEKNITVYTIGFTISSEILQRTATKGGGEYKQANNAAELEDVLGAFLSQITAAAGTLANVSVPTTGIASGTDAYVPQASPQVLNSFWPGDLVKYSYSDPTQLWGTRKWSANEELAKGGARTIYTVLDRTKKNADGSIAIMDTANLFALNNPLLTPEVLESQMSTYTRDQIVQFMTGVDVLDEDKDSNRTERRGNVLGDILHSTPAVVRYGSGASDPVVIYIGSNDGMLHAFNDTNGQELWAFVPPLLFPNLKYILGKATHVYGVDGSPKVVHLKGNRLARPGETADRRILVFGLRKGGAAYYALDITNRLQPSLLWSIERDGSIDDLGEAWSEPVFGNVKDGTDTKVVAFVGGGYGKSPENPKGAAVYAIDVLTGDPVWSVNKAATGGGKHKKKHAAMIYPNPSRVTAVDTNGDGYIDRLYLGDLGGQLWGIANYPKKAGDAPAQDGDLSNWDARLLFQSEGDRKIFEFPDILAGGDGYYLYFGTGNREEPKGKTVQDRIYMVKDRSPLEKDNPLSEKDLADVTTQPATAGEAATKPGWFIKLGATNGEKVLAPANVFMGTAYFSTYTPRTDVCDGGGDARVYALDARTSAAVFNFNKSNDVGGVVKDASDRSTQLGTLHGIPSEVGILIRLPQGEAGSASQGKGTVTPFVSVTGSPAPVGEGQLSISLVPYSWRDGAAP